MTQSDGIGRGKIIAGGATILATITIAYFGWLGLTLNAVNALVARIDGRMEGMQRETALIEAEQTRRAPIVSRVDSEIHRLDEVIGRDEKRLDRLEARGGP